jgi:ATPase subunit of ABC transporter with duplicated ATPase domains
MQNTLKDELLSSFIEEINILNEIETYQKQIELTVDNPNEMEDVLNQLSKLQELAITKNAYSLDSKVLKVMDSMGFSVDDGNLLVSSFSGGWKMRIGLAKILLLDPNILFLDEPTNHMDLDSVIWLESFLTKQNIPMLVVSHDREFLDKVCNKIIDVEDGKTISYKGNYSNFLEQRKLRLIEWREKYEKQQRYIKDEIKWIQKAKNDLNMAQQVKSRENLLEKFKLNDDYVDEPPRERKFRFRFPPAPRCGEIVIEASKLTHGYGNGKYQTLFKDINFFVERGNRIGFIGPNGSGKSTLMRIIGGLEEPKSGYSEYGSSNVISNYYAQNQADALNLDDTILETLQKSASSEISLTEIRTLLGQFMFKGDDVDKKIKVLSGGEKARVALCKLMLEPANLLLLDEVSENDDDNDNMTRCTLSFYAHSQYMKLV